jgi:hypothetical protein
LTLKNGDTLYRLTADSKNLSRCTGKCATVWVPVLLAPGQKMPVGDGVSGLGSFTRANGTHQVTLDGIPLYRFIDDKKPGQVTGNIKDTWGRWWSIDPKSPTTAPMKVKTSGSGGVGRNDHDLAAFAHDATTDNNYHRAAGRRNRVLRVTRR